MNFKKIYDQVQKLVRTGSAGPELFNLLSVADEIIPIRVSLSQAKCVWLNAAVAICQRYRLSEDIALLIPFTYDFKTAKITSLCSKQQ